VPRILLLDIETAPNTAFVWQLRQDYISPDQLVSSGYVLCVSAKWLGEKEVFFFSVYEHGQHKMLKAIHKLVEEADMVVHYNGAKFDIPTLQREYLTEGMSPPSPIKQIDLLKVVRKQFKFTSNKLDFVCQKLGLGNKVHHKGMALWRGCMEDNPADWKVMEAYNKQDVRLLESLYNKLLPWIPNHPNHTLYTDQPNSCPRCGGFSFQSRGTAHTASVAYKRYQCKGCKGWFRGDKLPHAKVKHVPIH
jgi:DNA polymerase elongation subunit (family B)